MSFAVDLAVVGGGLAGVCAAITAAREGLRVVLVQDRPVLGGNASSEVRLWALGATSHMGNNNRWAREGGVMDEIAVENLWRNPEGNPVLLDALLLDKVIAEPRLTLLLNSAVFEVLKNDAGEISHMRAFCSQNNTIYIIGAPLFCDASGDGVAGFLSGAAFRMGAESAAEFGEGLAPRDPTGETLGHTIYFYSKDAGRPVTFVPPSFALKDLGDIPKFRSFNARSQGCNFWWIEYGGNLDTIRDTEAIKWELWKVVYGIWNHIKNSGEYPEAASLTLEWVGSIPGKRESRRFEGDYILSQRDLVEQRSHDDAVSYGGWAIDLHPAAGIYSTESPCTQFHSKGLYQIPYRCLYSRNVPNLFLAGRIISASHVAFGSTRVMMTCAHNAQAVGVAAAICHEKNSLPRDLAENGNHLRLLQRRLQRTGQFIPHVELVDQDDLAVAARVTASSTRVLAELPCGPEEVPLDRPRALLVPLDAGAVPSMTFFVSADHPMELEWELRCAEKPGNFTPDLLLATLRTPIPAGSRSAVCVDFQHELDRDRYAFVCARPASGARLVLSDERITGVLSLAHGQNAHVAKSAVQVAPENAGIDRFEFWLPERRPGGWVPAVSFHPPAQPFSPQSVIRGYERPFIDLGAWSPDPTDPSPALTLEWPEPRSIERFILSFDTDFDHPMETSQWGHPERTGPFCVREFRMVTGEGRELFATAGNYLSRVDVKLTEPASTSTLRLEFPREENDQIVLFRIRVF